MSAAVVTEEPAFDVVCDASRVDDWLDARNAGVGASEIAIILGEAPLSWGSPITLYAQKLGKYERDLSDVEAVYWGKKLENEILSAYAERTGRRTMREGLLLRSRVHPWALCTLDGRTWDPLTRMQPWPLEVKNVSVFRGDDWIDGPPPHYYFQVQQQLLVTGEPKATIAALLGGQRMIWTDVYRDETAIRRIVHHGERFWARVQKREQPPAEFAQDRDALRAIYPSDNGETIELPRALMTEIELLEAAKADEKEAQFRRAILEAKVQEAMGEASRGIILGEATVTWKKQERKAFTVNASSSRVLRISRPKEQ